MARTRLPARSLALLLVRSLLLWLILPASLGLWLTARILKRESSRGLKLGHVAGWLDWNSSALLMRFLRFPERLTPKPWAYATECSRPSIFDYL